jgi:hypothetical protein
MVNVVSFTGLAGYWYRFHLLSSVEEYHFLEKQIDLTKRLDRFRDIEIVGK